ncbi:DUF4265 domain-containing protein [Alteromonas stellipolaris]|uniref:DUF4265 domain-containing protein n=1 Tax=Alteromonas stellipolaris TaxID=233316 RepID=UPI0021179F40|nr:DUF4265 domain-containing protein [Alteromonas stellipolaris]MCQ8847684.1 DUF4265 domain-containing protein [Alteromonas stellipolaris]
MLYAPVLVIEKLGEKGSSVSIEKVIFALDIENGWPPVSAEGAWCERVNGNYKLVNAPFFIPDLAYGDIFSATPDEVNQHIFEFEIMEESGHSVIWVMNNKDIDTTFFVDMLKRIGCKVETLNQFSLMSVDVPPELDLDALDPLLDLHEEKGLEYAFPVWRHGE